MGVCSSLCSWFDNWYVDNFVYPNETVHDEKVRLSAAARSVPSGMTQMYDYL